MTKASNLSDNSDILVEIPQKLPVIPIRDSVIYPGSIHPLLLGREASIQAADYAQNRSEGLIFLALQHEPEIDEVVPDQLHRTGVIARITSQVTLPNNLSKVLVEGLVIARVDEWFAGSPLMMAQVTPHVLKAPRKKAFGTIMRDIASKFKQYAQTTPDVPNEILQTFDTTELPPEILFTIAPFIKAELSLKQLLLEQPGFEQFAALISEIIDSSRSVLLLNRKIEREVRDRIQQSQKEYVLNEQLRLIHEELGHMPEQNSNPEFQLLLKQLKEKDLSAEVYEKVYDELKRLALLPQSSPEYSVVRNYIDWFISLPFGTVTEDNLSLPSVKRHLNKEHYGLSSIKERVLEHVAVLKLTEEKYTPILCLVGPPGVGKTTLGRSIAHALGREFIRISMGGIRDEAEVRGHRRTYVGAMPGKIIQGIKRAKVMNPVILLDEIDKMASDFRGDPASALLELLDPEQNKDFTDNFLEIGIDLSKALFITTANIEMSIPEPLRDRLEILRLAGYHSHEKLAIAQKHLIPKRRSSNGLTEEQLTLKDDAVYRIIHDYTREAGVRGLEKEIDKVMRKRAVEVVSKKRTSNSVDDKKLQQYLGVPRFSRSQLVKKGEPGLVTGLAWTSVGGEILQIECALMAGKGKLSLTGTLGDVMKESAQIALTLTKKRVESFGIDPKIFNETDIHIHLPEGAIPKDGPSAGIGLTLSLLSAFTKKTIDPTIAFTGEVSLSGKVHAIGGLPEKSIAALEAGVKTIMLPKENDKDVTELPAQVKKGVKIEKFNTIDEIIKKLFK
ncbi:MAG: endopeptidase La [Fibrobacterales bacterium]